jgi:hypothetical protein
VTPKKARKRKPFWMKIFIGFSAPIVVLFLAMCAFDIKYFAFESPICQDEREGFSKLKCGIRAAYEANARYVRPLPSDEAMIAHFRRHRADFERLVQIYRNDQSLYTPWGGLCNPPPETRIHGLVSRGSRVGFRGPPPLGLSDRY